MPYLSMYFDSISVGNILLPSRSTSSPLGKGAGRYMRQKIILPINTNPAGHFNMLTVCSNILELHLITFTFVSTITSIQPISPRGCRQHWGEGKNTSYCPLHRQLICSEFNDVFEKPYILPKIAIKYDIDLLPDSVPTAKR